MRSRHGRLQPGERARDLMKELQRALRRESWGHNFLQLAWTAGPTTYLALQGGYLLGYGQTAPPALVIYFGAYTVIAGLAAIAVRLLYQITRGRNVEQGARILRDCLDQLPRTLVAARDAALAACNEDDACLLAAKRLLANPDAEELAVEVAVHDLGGSEEVAHVARRIQVYRRSGLQSRIASERRRVEAGLEALCNSLESRSPETAALLRRLFDGQAPSRRRGRLRTEGFIERGLAAESEANERLMSLSDVEEILTFAVELLAGRKLTQISFEYSGDRMIGDAWNEVEQARRVFRSKLRSRNSRLRVTAEHLAKRIDSPVISMERIRDLPQLRDEVVAALDAWAHELDHRAPEDVSRAELDALRRVTASYRYLEQADAHLYRAHGRMVSTLERYQEVVRDRGARAGEAMGFADANRSGVRISETEIGLDDRARLTLARSIQSILRTHGSWKDEPVSACEHTILAIAVDVLSAIENHLPLYRPDVQQAIELSRAPSIESLEPGLSADVRAGWVTELVQDLETDLSEYALRRVGQLVRFHGMSLSPDTCTRIADRFGIDAELLTSLDRETTAAESPWSRSPMRIPERSDRLKQCLDGSVARIRLNSGVADTSATD